MSLLLCPNCNDYGFTWSIDDEVSPLTQWRCSECRYHAFEDESYESECPDCQYGHRVRLQDDDSIYWWCFKCARKTAVNT